jgi:hypothetical protein
MANEEAIPDVVLTFRDGAGREWLAAGYLGELERHERLPHASHVVETRSVHSFMDENIKLTGFTVIEPPSGSAPDAGSSTGE